MNQIDQETLQTYLDDHRAGAAAGRFLSRKMARKNAATGWGEKLAWLAAEIQADDHTLGELRAVLGVRGGLVKRVIAKVAAGATRLKLNRRIFGYSPLSRLLEAEAMMAGVRAKKCLWLAMRHGLDQTEALESFDFPALEKRAEDQIEFLVAFHEAAAKAAFSQETTSLGSHRAGDRH